MVSPEQKQASLSHDNEPIIETILSDDEIIGMVNVVGVKAINFLVYGRRSGGRLNTLPVNQTDVNLDKVRQLQRTVCGGVHKEKGEHSLNAGTMAFFFTEIEEDPDARENQANKVSDG